MGASKSVPLKGGVQQAINLNGVNYQGADMFIINTYPGLGECIVLFQQRNELGPYLQLPGGRCDSTHHSLEDTIYWELYEESKKSIRVSKRVFENMTAVGSYVEYPGDQKGIPGQRRCFVAKVPFISTKIFDQNSVILDNMYKRSIQKNLRKYMKTEKMVRMPLAQLGEIIAAGPRYTGIHIATFVKKAYMQYMEMKRMQKPIYDLGFENYSQEYNDNIIKIDGIEYKGLIDVYRKKMV